MKDIIDDKDGDYLGEKDGYELYYNSKFEFVFPCPFPSYEEYEKMYKDSYYHINIQKNINHESYFDRFFHDIRIGMLRLERYSEFIDLNSHTSILDIGCGNGGFIIAASKLELIEDCLGIDPDVEMINYLNNFKELNSLFEPLDTYRLNKINKRYDLITMHDVFEHLYYPCKTLYNIHSVATSGSILIIDIPDLDSGLNDILSWKHTRPQQHIFLYTEWSIDNIIYSIFPDSKKITSYRPIKDKMVLAYRIY